MTFGPRIHSSPASRTSTSTPGTGVPTEPSASAAAVVLGREVGDGRRGLGHPVELGDVAVRQPLEHAPLQLGRDRRGRVLDVPERRQVGGVGAGRVEQHREHGRDEHGVRDPLALDRLQHRGGVEAREQDLLRPDPRAREQVGDPGDVEHRAHVQPALVGAVAGGGEVVLRVGEQVAVAEHHALGRAGGAAGVGDGRERVGREVARLRAAGRRRAPPSRAARHPSERARSRCSASVISSESLRVLRR